MLHSITEYYTVFHVAYSIPHNLHKVKVKSLDMMLICGIKCGIKCGIVELSVELVQNCGIKCGIVELSAELQN